MDAKQGLCVVALVSSYRLTYGGVVMKESLSAAAIFAIGVLIGVALMDNLAPVDKVCYVKECKE